MPSLSFEEAKEILKNEDEEFARIYRKHRELDQKVLELEERRYLTPDEEIQEILHDGNDVDDMTNRLVDAALAAGGRDNVSTVVCKV